MPGRYFINKSQWFTGDGFRAAHDTFLKTVSGPHGQFSSDAMVVWGRSLGFLDDEALVAAWQKHATLPHEKAIVWRTAVLVWAARQALRREGGFIECACYAGTTARILLDVVDLSGREVFLYDLFEHTPDMEHHALPLHGPDLYQRTCERFPEPNVHVVKGPVPESFSQGLPDKIALVHIDMNSVAAEIGALEAASERLSPGAVIVLDDFGWIGYREQHLAEREWFSRRGLPILELPTGQGIVIW